MRVRICALANSWKQAEVNERQRYINSHFHKIHLLIEKISETFFFHFMSAEMQKFTKACVVYAM